MSPKAGWTPRCPTAAGAYAPWGATTYSVDAFGATPDAHPEPNNLLAPELCAVANASSLQGDPAVWGWADARCITKRISLCRKLGGWQDYLGSASVGNAASMWVQLCQHCPCLASHGTCFL